MNAKESEKWRVICECEINKTGFWNGLGVWIERPHILNKRINVMSIVSTVNIVQSQSLNGVENFTWNAVVHKLNPVSLDLTLSGDQDVLKKTFRQSLESVGVHVSDDSCGLKISLRCHIPKNKTRHYEMYELVIKDIVNSTAVFVPYLQRDQLLKPVLPTATYAFQYDDSTSKMKFLVFTDIVESDRSDELSNYSWLSSVLWPKVVQWIREDSDASQLPRKKLLPSLSLIPSAKYGLLYAALKTKYAPHFLKIWPEKTDPTKVIHQILGVATYLIVLWEAQRNDEGIKEKQSFVDLGCGNGLLTHILSSEGHHGIGVDVKRRKIWDFYAAETTLLEQPIVPSSQQLYPSYDWIIGCHSDELTPWIPVIAARSSPTTKFFILPCCAHDFDCKFQRRNSKLSIYEDYTGFVQEIAEVCGFYVKKDKLKIPSTKRIAIIGSQRKYSPTEWPSIDGDINAFIQQRCSKVSLPSHLLTSTCTSSTLELPTDEESPENLEKWAANFRARPPVQQVRNCTRLSTDLKSSIVQIIANNLLRSASTSVPIHAGNGTVIEWHTGGCLTLKELATKIPQHQRQLLKQEFGGLKTLLKNHYYIFEVSGEKVSLRNYSVALPFPLKRKPQPRPIKVKPCWFFSHHPDGCSLSSGQCPFIH